MNNVKKNSEEKGDVVLTNVFALGNECEGIQIMTHVSNLCTTYSTSKTLSTLQGVLLNLHNIQALLGSRAFNPLLFRSAQLVHHYGEKEIRAYLRDVYGIGETVKQEEKSTEIMAEACLI